MGKEKGVRGRERENGQWGANRKSKENRINGKGEKRRGAVVCQSQGGAEKQKHTTNVAKITNFLHAI